MVRSYLQLLEKRYEDQLDDEAQEFITYAVDGASRMREMIEGLLEYSRVQSRGRQPEPVDVNEVVDGVLENLHVAIQEADATVEVHDLGEALADEGQLGHVFQNLVSNALSHAGPSPHIEIGVEPAEEGFACFFVADDGAGIPEQEQADLFGIFHRGSNAAGEGTGIGLAVCQRIVDRHDGEIGVKSAPGEGAKFWFTLPTANAANSHTPTDRAPDSDPASTDPER